MPVCNSVTSATLPRTGADLVVLLAIGVPLVLLGSVLVLWSARRSGRRGRIASLMVVGLLLGGLAGFGAFGAAPRADAQTTNCSTPATTSIVTQGGSVSTFTTPTGPTTTTAGSSTSASSSTTSASTTTTQSTTTTASTTTTTEAPTTTTINPD